MIKINDKKRSKETLESLESRFLDGERLTVEEIIKEYLKDTNTVSYLLSREKAKRWLIVLKNRFWNIHHLWFGNLNNLGQYGLPQTEAEYRYGLLRYYAFVKGNIIRAIHLREEATGKGILIGQIKDTPFFLPEPLVEEKKERS